MQGTGMILACLITACTTAIAITVLRRFSVRLGLVDHPNERKHHVGHVPLVGGVAMFIGLIAGALSYTHFSSFGQILLGSSGVLVVLGTLDDRFDLSVRARLLVQITVILTVIVSTGVYIHTLGQLFGYQVELGWAGIPFTVIAVIGLLNAFNMMDGIDGLAGGLTLVSIAAISLFAGSSVPYGSKLLMALLTAATLPYLAANLGIIGRKIFLGDAGSMGIGFLLAWILIRLSQHPGTHLSPVDVLWCVALPVLDTLAVMYRRMRQRVSPFKPDRGHIHHLLLDMGLSPRAVLVALIALAASMAFLGSVTRSLGLGSGSNLAAFCILAMVYTLFVTRIRGRQQARSRHIASRAAANDDHVADVLRMPIRTDRGHPVSRDAFE